MTHEFKNIILDYLDAKTKGIKTVLATVVALEGSSYRRPGVRMLILEDGSVSGAVSGGCVEKEIIRQAESVFKENTSKIMTYDGRFRLGCEGILYVLLEPFRPKDEVTQSIRKALKARQEFTLQSYFEKKEGTHQDYGSVMRLGSKTLSFFEDRKISPEMAVYEQQMSPCFKLFIIGAEHDAVQLCAFAVKAGWEVVIVADPKDEKNILDFEGANEFLSVLPENFPTEEVDQQTAVMLMNHSYAKDLNFLMSLQYIECAYFGLLGPHRRREKLFEALMEHCPELSYEFIDGIHGPAGLNIGAETPQEIAIAIMAEILSVTRNKKPVRLKNKKTGIHD
ncbi:Xanthine and CO dehydrogenase maturation factor, XdhC/CoxF family [Arenibacter nanhaiticus]|uniref:Xanthine and CO dehydrogenase maturation factor, XdhC/CoxF family n=1 Tax=Arenibacter nanhaiticus TaxID=558155 RepID=A0A1M6FS32_9FLAO|nr:XdhC family protein [Arenibacter nanhaiticus]SHJ00496.1 Xanthine and CO dehydrogenase maturation factor, XdhC/CoxF family [Arenibacter nanhaiticus]